MALRIVKWTEGICNLKRIIRIFVLSLLASLMVVGGSPACKKDTGEELAPGGGGQTAKEGIIEFEGTAKVGIGKYLFIPEIRGFDIVVQGQIESGDVSVLVDKEVRGKGAFSADRPSVLIANSIDIKESDKGWRNVFKRTEEVVLEDYLDLKARDEFQSLKDLSYDKKESWEKAESAKVFGKLEKETVTEGEEQKDIYRIIVLNDKNKEVGKIIVDSFTDYAQYYMKKLRLFDNFWFYITVKNTVEWRVRRRTRELFHADVLFSGLF